MNTEAAKLIVDTLAGTEGVVNPGASGRDVPLYEHEVQTAVDLIKQLEMMLAP